MPPPAPPAPASRFTGKTAIVSGAAFGIGRATAERLAALVSNAAVNNRGPAHELSRASWDAMLGVNLTATFLGVRACVAGLAERQGAVVVTSSVHALIGLPGNPAYAAAKGGLTADVHPRAGEVHGAVMVPPLVPC